MRGDWKCFAETFHLPSWAHKSGICMKCTATTANFKNVATKFQKLKQTAGFEEANIHHLQRATVFDFQLQVGLAACGGSWGDTGLFGQLFSLFIAKTWQECIRAASTLASTDQAILHGA